MNQDKFLRWGIGLEYITLAWNIFGCVIVLVAAYLARSSALAGFGIDSVIEIFASLVVLKELAAVTTKSIDRSEQLMGVAFLLLGVYITIQSILVLMFRIHAGISVLGIGWLTLTFFIMLFLAYGKHKVGKALGNSVLKKESIITFIDAFLAAAILIGIALNALFGFWWADPIAALVMGYYGFHEGTHILFPNKILMA